MPGITGIVVQGAAAPATSLEHSVQQMQQRMAPATWHRLAHWSNQAAGVALASVALETTAQRFPRIALSREGDHALVLDGELYDAPRLARELKSQGHDVPASDPAAILLAGCQVEGSRFLRRVHGSFAAAWWDAAQRRLVLMTDRFGTRPVYYRVTQRQLRFGSGLAAVVAPDEPLRINPRGLAQFFTFGYYLRDDTSVEGVRVLPAAAWCTFDVRSGNWTSARYDSLAEWVADSAPGDKNEDSLLERLEAALVTAVERTTSDASNLGISLSGGLDARTILGLLDTRRTPVRAVCLGMPGSLDHRASRQLAQFAGCPLHLCVLDRRFLSAFADHLQAMVTLTDGQYLSQCIVVPTLSVYRTLGIHTLLRGHAGELLHLTKAYNYSLDPTALNIQSDEQLRDWLYRRLKAYMLQGVRRPLFRGELDGVIESLAAESLDADLQEFSGAGKPLERIGVLFLTQRLRRETPLSLLKFRSVVEPRLPYLDPDFIRLVLATPVTMRLDEHIQSWILKRRRPEFLRVVNSNTGAPLTAPAWWKTVAGLKMRVLAKLGVPGYQPYERLGLWLRRELAPLVQQILLDSRTLDRGIYDPDGLRRVVRAHLEQGHNHTFLLMALMIFELGLRRLEEGNGPGVQLPRWSTDAVAAGVA